MHEAELSESERRLWMEFPHSGHVDLSTGDPARDNPAEASTWGEDRTVRAEKIIELLTGARPVEEWQSPALVLSGALITGVLDLRGRTVRPDVLLRGCAFAEPLLLEEATCATFRLSRCRLPGVHAPWLQSSGSIHLRDCDVGGLVDLSGAHIGRQLVLSRSRVRRPGDVAVLADGMVVDGDCLCRDGAKIDGEFSMLAARIGGELRFTAQLQPRRAAQPGRDRVQRRPARRRRKPVLPRQLPRGGADQPGGRADQRRGPVQRVAAGASR
jgi:hypothetical protein